MDKGTASNLISAGLCGVGLLLPRGVYQEVVFQIGLFAFSGGITNALAVKMLFDRVPGLVGSGVIPARFKEIRVKVKNLILEHFFDEAYLREFCSSESARVDWHRYVKAPAGGSGAVEAFIAAHWDKVGSKEAIQPLIDREIEKLMDSSIGGLLAMMGPGAIQPAVTQFVTGFLGSLRAKVLEVAASAGPEELKVEIDLERLIADIRASVESLLSRKLQELDAERVKRMIEDVIRDHLGWLVVWGNVLGGLLGLIPIALQRLGG